MLMGVSCVKIIIQDDNSDSADNAENDELKYVAEVDLDAIRPLPIDWPYEFLPASGQVAHRVDEQRVSMFRGSSKGRRVETTIPSSPINFCKISRKTEKRYRAEEGTSTRPRNLRPIRSRKPIPIYTPRKEVKNESWNKHLTELIRKYGKDNSKKNMHTRINFRAKIPESSRINKRRETCNLDPRRGVQGRISNTRVGLHFRENEKKQPRGPFEGNRRNIWSEKRLHEYDSGSDSDSEGREEGEISENERRGSNKKSIHCRHNYCVDEDIQESPSKKARKHPLLKLTY